MLLWSLKQKEDSAMLDLQTTVATVTMWLLLGLRSRSQEMEADRHMLLVGDSKIVCFFSLNLNTIIYTYIHYIYVCGGDLYV